uniref:NADH-ubiquinone oxidoreductase chain 2 n=1 Tax=Haemodracon trachyrhinus TaxID=1216929 RepID=A0A7R7G1T7_9SAUR|nr:NADH dehydrogenase subunit 2 [Haemodracon trachyrhinus]
MTPMVWSIMISSLATGTVITMSSHHWITAWLGLELNTLSILPLIIKSHHPRATEAATKYFIVQTTASSLILFTATMNAYTTGQWLITEPMNYSTTTLLLTAAMLKLGLAPTYAWYPEVLQGSNMHMALTISTWQKIAPLTFLYLTFNHLPTHIIITLGLMSAMIGGWAGINQTQMRKIMAFSSISHMGWLLTTLSINTSLTTLTLLIYTIMTSAMFLMLAMTASKSLTDLGTSWSNTPTLQTTLLITLMSLGGLPPLSGFIPKLLILKELTLMNLMALSTTLIMTSLLSLFFYTRITYLTVTTTPPTPTGTEYKWRFKPTYQPTIPMLAMITTALLPITPLLLPM